MLEGLPHDTPLASNGGWISGLCWYGGVGLGSHVHPRLARGILAGRGLSGGSIAIWKLTLKLIGSFIIIAVILLLYDSDDSEFLLVLVGTGVAALVSIGEIVETCKARRETEASESERRERKLRDILDNFKANFASTLIELRLIGHKSELTYKRVLELSHDPKAFTLLNDRGAVGIRNELEEFFRLNEQKNQDA